MLDTKCFNPLQIKCNKNSAFTPEAENSSVYTPGECSSTIQDNFKMNFSWVEHLNSKRKQAELKQL